MLHGQKMEGAVMCSWRKCTGMGTWFKAGRGSAHQDVAGGELCTFGTCSWVPNCTCSGRNVSENRHPHVSQSRPEDGRLHGRGAKARPRAFARRIGTSVCRQICRSTHARGGAAAAVRGRRAALGRLVASRRARDDRDDRGGRRACHGRGAVAPAYVAWRAAGATREDVARDVQVDREASSRGWPAGAMTTMMFLLAAVFD